MNRRSLFNSALLSFACASTVGCGLVKVQTKGSTAPSSTSQESTEQAVASPSPAVQHNGAQAVASPSPAVQHNGAYDGAAYGAALTKVYADYSYQDCQGAGCPGEFAAAAGIQEYDDPRDQSSYRVLPNPRAFMSNPDPDWLIGWEQMSPHESVMNSDARLVYAAMVVAATYRSWLPTCDARFAEWQAQQEQAAESLDSQIAAAKAKPTAYERLAALVSLRPIANAKMAPSLRLAVERNLLEEFRKAGVEYSYWHDDYAPHESVVQSLVSRGTEQEEHDAFCLAAMKKEVDLSYVARAPNDARAYVKPPITNEQAAAVSGRIAGDRNSIPKTFRRSAEFDTNKLMRLSSANLKGVEGKFARFTPKATVTKVSREGNVLTIELRSKEEDVKPYNCRESNKVESIDANGRVNYRGSCKYGKVILDEEITVSFEGVPTSVNIQAGDRLSFYGRPTALTSKALKQSNALSHFRATMRINGNWLVSVASGQSENFLVPKK